MSEYNGYTNYATWLVRLHLDNDYGTYLSMKEAAEGIVAQFEDDNYVDTDDRDKMVHSMIEFVKSFIDVALTGSGEFAACLRNDLAGAAVPRSERLEEDEATEESLAVERAHTALIAVDWVDAIETMIDEAVEADDDVSWMTFEQIGA